MDIEFVFSNCDEIAEALRNTQRKPPTTRLSGEAHKSPCSAWVKFLAATGIEMNIHGSVAHEVTLRNLRSLNREFVLTSGRINQLKIHEMNSQN
jgi:hypothetical protein